MVLGSMGYNPNIPNHLQVGEITHVSNFRPYERDYLTTIVPQFSLYTLEV